MLSDAIPAVPGLLNVLIQGGSFALLAYAIVYGVPKLVDKQLNVWRAVEEGQSDTIRRLTEAFQAEQKFERAQCSAQFERMMGSMDAQTKTLNETQLLLSKAVTQLSTQLERHHEFSVAAVAKITETKTNHG